MYGNPQRRSASDVQDLRRDGGRWLKDQRERVGLSQRQLAELVGAEYYTFISQLETGRGRIPPIAISPGRVRCASMRATSCGR